MSSFANSRGEGPWGVAALMELDQQRGPTHATSPTCTWTICRETESTDGAKTSCVRDAPLLPRSSPPEAAWLRGLVARVHLRVQLCLSWCFVTAGGRLSVFSWGGRRGNENWLASKSAVRSQKLLEQSGLSWHLMWTQRGVPFLFFMAQHHCSPRTTQITLRTRMLKQF